MNYTPYGICSGLATFRYHLETIVKRHLSSLSNRSQSSSPSCTHSSQLAINEANGLNRLPSHLTTEKEEYVYRSYLALGQHHIILNEIKDGTNTPISLQAIKLLANVMADASRKEISMLQMQEWLNDNTASCNTTVQLVAAILYMHDDNLKEAVKIVHRGVNMEQHALLVQLYLRMDRLDLAQKEVKAMKAVDEDSTLAQVSD